jgi:hypothetical protein
MGVRMESQSGCVTNDFPLPGIESSPNRPYPPYCLARPGYGTSGGR